MWHGKQMEVSDLLNMRSKQINVKKIQNWEFNMVDFTQKNLNYPVLKLESNKSTINLYS